MLLNIFRADSTNAGDWWSPPIRYFKFKEAQAIDILRYEQLPNCEGIFVVGGGGLGRPFFKKAIEALAQDDRRYKLISWGSGCDTLEDRLSTVEKPSDLLGDYFAKFDINGLRIYPPSDSHRWVPCASCMWNGFDKYRRITPTESIGLYHHKRVPIHLEGAEGFLSLTNEGDSIEEKVSYMSRFETIITNSYHGVYWATLLNRRVICVPFKSGLYSFRHPPFYAHKTIVGVKYNDIRTYPDALEECRQANIDFYKFLSMKIGI